MGFPGRFLKWVGLLYNGIYSKILVNGHLTKAVNVRSGVRQGCPLSPLLFVAAIEPLAQILRRDKWINGLDLPGGLTVTCTLYMDDVTLLCSDVLSAQRALDLTDWYGRASGAKLNRSKSEAQLFGPWGDGRLDLAVDFKTEMTILGIKFDNEGGGRGNWSDVLGKVRQRLGFWGLRHLTIEGKVLIYKSVILPVLLLLCSVFSPPRSFLLGLERAVFYFLWGSKWERLRREVVKKRKENGGKALPDPHLFLGSKFTALQISYATAPSGHSKTAALARFWMGSYLRKLKVLTPDRTTPVAFNLPTHYVFIRKFLTHFALEGQDVTILTNAKSLVSLVQDREAVSPVPGLTLGEAQQAWRNVAHPALQNKLKDVAWMALHEVLPVRAVMHSRGMARTSTCPRSGCGQPETVRHLLWECGVARDLWAATGPLISPYLPAGGVHPTYHLVVSGVGQGADQRPAADFTALWLTLNNVKAALWTARNLLVGRRVTVSRPALRRLAGLATGINSEAGITARRPIGEGVKAQPEGPRAPRLLAPADAPPPQQHLQRVGAAGIGGDLRWRDQRQPGPSGGLGGAS